MTPTHVADVGNTRIKWGRCAASGVAESASLPPDDPTAWQQQRTAWLANGPGTWAVAGVHPARCDQLAEWLRQQGDHVVVIEHARQLPLRVALEHPDRVGIDRLLDAVAANARRRPGVPAVVVDAGSAVTVDSLDPDGVFRGGAIFPGLRLMAQALHDYTALLPLVEVRQPLLPPGTSTTAAMQVGVYWAVVGGVDALMRKLGLPTGTAMDVFLTGGDAALLAAGLERQAAVWPHLTLEGLRLTAEALP